MSTPRTNSRDRGGNRQSIEPAAQVQPRVEPRFALSLDALKHVIGGRALEHLQVQDPFVGGRLANLVDPELEHRDAFGLAPRREQGRHLEKLRRVLLPQLSAQLIGALPVVAADPRQADHAAVKPHLGHHQPVVPQRKSLPVVAAAEGVGVEQRADDRQGRRDQPQRHPLSRVPFIHLRIAGLRRPSQKETVKMRERRAGKPLGQDQRGHQHGPRVFPDRRQSPAQLARRHQVIVWQE